MPQDAFSAITAAAIARGVMFDCDPLKRTVEGLRQRDAAAAQAMAGPATRACP
jgi:hypothetical protein